MTQLATDALILAGLTLKYPIGRRTVTAVDNFSLSVRQGERLVLLGPSGCGKTSVLKAVAGFVPPAAGAISLDGRSVTKPGPDRIMIFQEFDQLLPWKTVAANVRFPLRAVRRQSRRQAAARAREVIEKVGLAEFADAYPHMLSGGMKQRVAIARALALAPDILLMDEPFAALDALTRSAMQQELLRLWADTRFTLLFVTHSIEEALVVGNRIAVLSSRPGTVKAVYEGLHAKDRSEPAFWALHQRIAEEIGIASAHDRQSTD